MAAHKAVPVKPAAKIKTKTIHAPAVKSTPAARPSAGPARQPAAANVRAIIPPPIRVASSRTPVKSSARKVPVTLPGVDAGITKEDGRYALPLSVTIRLPPGYRPSSKEEYMGPYHLAYFREKLRKWREDLVEESRQTMENLRDEVRDVGDDAERATRETENSLELRTRDRYRKLISKIDNALRRIEEGRYGFCEETDEEIGVERLEARPIATLSLDAQERREHLQKQMGD